MNKKRIFFITLIILLAIFVVLILSFKNSAKKIKTASFVSLIDSSTKNLSTPFSLPEVNSASKKIQDVFSPAVNNFIKVNFLIGDRAYTANILAGDTVFEAMNQLSLNGNFSFKAKNYSGLGYFVEEINGIKNADGFYWTLYINNKYSTVGVSQYKLMSGDSVWWKYEKK